MRVICKPTFFWYFSLKLASIYAISLSPRLLRIGAGFSLTTFCPTKEKAFGVVKAKDWP